MRRSADIPFGMLSEWTLRAADPGDIDAIAGVWHAAWHDAHLGRVPQGLLPFRQLEDFRARVPSRIPGTTVAVNAAGIVGFVTVHADELELLFVARTARGSGVAAALLQHGEERIAAHFDRAWLTLISENARARRFYSNHGWIDAGPLAYAAETAAGNFPVSSRRYEKRLPA